MVTKYRVKREGSNYLGVSAEFSSHSAVNPIAGTEKVLCQTNTFTTLSNGQSYTVGPTSASNPIGCVYIKKVPGDAGEAYDLIPVWSESNGWTP